MDVSNSKPYRFLLGGYDLEMATIKQLLEENHCLFHDKHLAWGARLSAYADAFNDEEHFVGIELIEDIPTPPHYLAIDHHNEKSRRPASILQVLEMLHIEPTDYQKLVAANDSGYIPAMQAMGATDEVIKKIRTADRKALGVTAEVEKLAEKAIRENLLKVGDLILVDALSSGFSPIVDRLYPFQKLLISYQNHFVYYGIGSELLAMEYRKLIKDHKVFYGGGADGFLGTDDQAFTKEGIETLKAEVINHLLY